MKKLYQTIKKIKYNAFYNPTFMGLILNIFSPTYWMVYTSWNHLNIFKTLWVNFHYLPFKQAKKLPIFIYGNCKFMRVSGSIVLDTDNIFKGMIKINKSASAACNSGTPTEILLTMGKIIFEGEAFISTGCRIIVNNGGKLTLGNLFKLNSQNTIGCFNNIMMKSNVVIGHQCQIFDTNFHHIIDLSTNRVMRSNGKISIGENTWLGNRITILHGVSLAPYTIVSSNSLVTKSFSESYSIIGGIPSKVLKVGMKRLFDKKLEAEIHPYFSQSLNNFYQL